MSARTTALAVAAVTASLTSSVPADVIFEHSGSTNPASEGWIVDAGPGVDTGPTGGRAWFVDDPSSEAGSAVLHFRTLSPCQETRIDQVGWTLRACVRIDDPDAVHSIFAGYNTGSRRYDLWLSSTPSDDPVALLQLGNGPCGPTGTPFTLLDGGTPCHDADFHLYELVFDPVAGTADLLVDGVERVSDHAGHTLGLGNYAGVVWGAGSSCADGYAEFALVQFEINGPEPPVSDVNCDGVVDVQDLLLLLAGWGSCVGCAEDLDGSTVVDTVDLLLLLSEWGAVWP